MADNTNPQNSLGQGRRGRVSEVYTRCTQVSDDEPNEAPTHFQDWYKGFSPLPVFGQGVVVTKIKVTISVTLLRYLLPLASFPAIIPVLAKGAMVKGYEGAVAVGERPLADAHLPTEDSLALRLGWQKGDARRAFGRGVDDLVNAVVQSPRSYDYRAVVKKCAPYLRGDLFLEGLPPQELLGCLPLLLRQEAVAEAQGNTKKVTTSPAVSSRNHKRIVKSRVTAGTVATVAGFSEWNELEGKSFQQAFEKLKVATVQDAATLMEWADAPVVAGKDPCAFGGAQAALASRLESLLPDDGVWLMLRRTYDRGAACLPPSDLGFERFHARMGLLLLSRGEEEAAKKVLQKSLEAYEPQEESRALFWIGLLDQRASAASQGGSMGEWNQHWHRLRKLYPLSIHAVLASHFLGKDPFLDLDSEHQVLVDAGLPSSLLPWKSEHYAQLVFEILLARGELDAAFKWSEFCQRHIKIGDHKKILYFAFLSHQAENYRAAIAWSHRYFNETGHANVSPALVKMLYPRPYAAQILERSGEVDPVLVFALIRQESAFYPEARSSANAQGLMQLLPTTANTLRPGAARDLYDPEENIELGVRYLKKLLVKFDGAVEKVLAAYNAGAKHIDSWGNRYSEVQSLLFADLIPFKETRNYVSLIQRNAYWYGRLMTMQGDDLSKKLKRASAQAQYKSAVVGSLLHMAWSGHQDGQARVALVDSVRSGLGFWGDSGVLFPWDVAPNQHTPLVPLFPQQPLERVQLDEQGR